MSWLLDDQNPQKEYLKESLPILFYGFQKKFDTSCKNIKYNKNENITWIFLFILTQRGNTTPTTHLRAHYTRVSNTNQDNGFGTFVYEVFCQDKKNYIIFWCFKLKCLLPIRWWKTPNLHQDLLKVIFYLEKGLESIAFSNIWHYLFHING